MCKANGFISTVVRSSLVLFSLFSSVCIAAFPIHNPYKATLVSLGLREVGVEFEDGSVSFHAERGDIPLVGTRNRALYSYALQNSETAPLVFIIPGMGGSALSGGAKFIGEDLFKQGYSVVTLPSTTHWTFALSISQTGRPGYLPEDAKDFYRLLKTIKNKLYRDHRLAPKSYSLAGFSYGALDAAAIRNQDQVEHKFNFKKVVLVNPPLDKDYALRFLDQAIAEGSEWSDQRKFSLVSYVLGKLGDLGKKSLQQILQDRDIENLKLTDSEIRWLIATQFKRTLADVIYVGQEISDDGILPAKGNSILQGQRIKAAVNVSFADYLERIVLPAQSKVSKVGLAHMHQENSLLEILSKDSWSGFKNRAENGQVEIIHSQDDFLSFPGTAETQTILAQAKGHVTLFEEGGHIGNLWDPDFLAALHKVLE